MPDLSCLKKGGIVRLKGQLEIGKEEGRIGEMSPRPRLS